MSNINPHEELAARTALILKDESALPELLSEFDNLEPREAELIATALSCEPDSMEHLHAVARLSVLVASGVVSSELASVAVPNPEKRTLPWSRTSYELSRDAFLDVLGEQQFSADILTNPYDIGGKLTRMVARGDSKQQIKDYLEGNSYYQGQRDFTTIAPEDLDIQEQSALMKYLEFTDALENVVDPEEAPDFSVIAKEMVKPYDQDSKVAEMIDSRAASVDVFEALSDNPQWAEDSYDYVTSTDVDRPSQQQKDKWNNFASIVFAIKDLDDR